MRGHGQGVEGRAFLADRKIGARETPAAARIFNPGFVPNGSQVIDKTQRVFRAISTYRRGSTFSRSYYS